LFLPFVICLGILLTTGCLLKRQGSDDINRQIKVFDVALFSSNDNKVISGVNPRVEPCLSGTEYYYDSLDIAVGYAAKGYVRKITTTNKNTGMFNISAGESFAQAKEKILRLGFVQADTPYKFVKDWCLFTLLVNEKQGVFGMTVEVLD
jgi:hypothetical protein